MVFSASCLEVVPWDPGSGLQEPVWCFQMLPLPINWGT